MSLRNWLLLAVVATAATLVAMYLFAPESAPVNAASTDAPPPADGSSNQEAAVAHILIAHIDSEPPIEGVTRSLSEARELALRLALVASENDADFAALAREYSDDARAQKTGGYLGIMPRGIAPLSFQVPLFNLEPGQIYPAAETPQGFHVIKRLPIRRVEAQHILVTWEGSEATAVHASRTHNQARLLAEEILRECRRDDADFCELVARYSDDTGSRFQCGSIGVVEPTMTDPAFETALFKLRPGGISGIVETPFGFHIIRRP